MRRKRNIRKVLVANRGEIAVRIMRTCKELGLGTVAVCSEADRASPHALLADEVCVIGPPPSAQSYLDMDRILGAARATGVDAIHPGYGFLSENAAFAARVEESGFIFIGPGADSIRMMGDKTEARRLVRQAGVPTVPGTEKPLNDVREAEEFCRQHGYPILIKAAAGGGGKGMRVVHSDGELPGAVSAARSEARSAFGDPRVYIEKYLQRPRHIEFQILSDGAGNIVHLGERECSIQRRHQKVIEESPSVIVTPGMRRSMGETAVMAARACGYRNAGTIEFLVDEKRDFYFLEMNTRLQVEHPVTEMRTGIDLVALQLQIAMGRPLPFTQDQVDFRGHAIECRICAEDPANGFLPSTGKVLHLRPPEGIGVRDDRGIESGGEVSVFYDPLLAKLIVWGATREEAVRRMRRALHEYEILGVQTNIAFCLFVLNHEKFLTGDFDTHFITDHFRPEMLPQPSLHEQQAAALLRVMLDGNPAMPDGEDTSSPVLRRRRRESQADATPGNWKAQRHFLMRGSSS